MFVGPGFVSTSLGLADHCDSSTACKLCSLEQGSSLTSLETYAQMISDWNKGLNIKIPKKGDLQNCDKW